MGKKSKPTLGVGLACLLLLGGALFSPAEAGKGSTTVPAPTGVAGQTGQTGVAGQTGQTGVAGQTGQTGVAGQTGQTGVGGQSGQTPPVITTSLLVNNAAAACGASVASGAAVCLMFTPDQSGTAMVSIQKGTAMANLASGAVTAGQSYMVCVTAGAADGLMRTFTVTVTNSAGLSSFQQCAYGVAVVSGKTGVGGQTGQTGKAGPTVTASLLVNGSPMACGATVASGATVCLQFASDQSGTAVLSIQKGAASANLGSQAVVAGQTYSACVIAGAADGQTRTFTVTVTNSAGQSSFQQCSYGVAAVAGKSGVGGKTGVGGATGQSPPALTAGLLVNGLAAACGTTVSSGAQVCLQYTTDQSGSAVVTIQSGAGTATLVSQAVVAGQTYSTCVTAGAGDGLSRTFTVTVTGATGLTTTRQCSYLVALVAGKGGKNVQTPVAGQTGQTGVAGQTGQTGVGGATGQTGSTVTTSLLLNGAAAACGATAASGSMVCLQLTSSQTGNAVVTLQNETGTTTGTVASGAVTAGTTYNVCVTAGAATGLMRTFTVTVTTAGGQTLSQQCSYGVQ